MNVLYPSYHSFSSFIDILSCLSHNFCTSSVVNPKYVSLITPSRWFAGDAQDKSFLKLREFIKDNNHISKIINYPDCKDVFDNVTIKGGVSYFLFEDNYSGDVDFYNSNAGEKTKQTRKNSN